MIAGRREIADAERPWSSRRQLARDRGFVSSGNSHRNRFRTGRIANFNNSFVYADIRIAQALREAWARLPFYVLRVKIGTTYSHHSIRSMDFESAALIIV